ncbi:MAG TPA: DUF4214 domain-containing protein [Pyrinomonadaceae bacterium]|nr:DUF4214 domain-containing protein [Pyrinomonadaceae bacterium]
MRKTDILAFDTAGKSISGWPVALPYGFTSDNPVVVDQSTGVVYARTGVGFSFSGFPIAIQAFNPDGTQKWRKDYDNGNVSGPTLAQGADGKLYTFIGFTGVVGLDNNTGAQICNSTSNATVLIGGPDGVFTGATTKIVSIKNDCTETSIYTIPDGSEISLLKVDLGKIFAIDRPASATDSSNYRLFAVSVNGTFLWRNSVIHVNGNPIRSIKNGILYVIGDDTTDSNKQKLFLVDSTTGQILNSVETSPVCDSCGVAVATDGTIYLNDLGSTKIYKLQGSGPVPSVTPLIFIPGIAGSTLNKDVVGPNTNVWPYFIATGIDFYALTLDPAQPQPPTILANDALRRIPAGHPGIGYDAAYGSLLEMLTDPNKGGYTEYQVNGDPTRRTFNCDLTQQANHPNLFVFAYDWRLSDRDNAQLLKQYVQCVQSFYPNTHVDILTHSMGGLLARRFILENPNVVNRLITIAAPWLGAPKAINTLETGDFFDDWKDKVNSSTLKRLVEFYPGAFELIPSRGYMTLGGVPYTESQWDADGNGKVDGNYTDYDKQLVAMLDHRYPNVASRPGTRNKIFHDFPGQDNWNTSQGGVNPDPNVKYYHIFGKQKAQQTISNVATVIKTKCTLGVFNCKSKESFYVNKDYGDGTVPVLSANRIGNGKNFNAIGVTPVPVCTEDTHTDLAKNADVQRYVLSILKTGQPSLPPPCSLPAQAVTGKNGSEPTSALTSEQAYYLTISGAATVTVADSSGNSTAPINGTGIGGTVPGVNTSMLDDETFFIAMSADGSYTITFRTDSDPLSIELTKGTAIDTAQAIRYVDLTLPANVTVMLKITPQGIDDLRYDKDGDGIFETTVTPSISVSGTAAQDTDPPTVSISENRQQTGTLVTITSADSGSGVKAVYYSLDGTQYQPYTQPFMVDPYRTPTVYVFADDNVANRSGLVTFQLTAPASNIQSSQSSYSVGKGDGHATIIINRVGDTTGQATVNYATSDTAGLTPCGQPNTGVASSRCNYATTIGTLSFAAGETSKTIFIPIVNSAYAEGNKSFKLTLINPAGATLGIPATATITIINNNSVTGGNPIVDSSFFVRQQYIDFLGREPDPPGLAGWLDVLNNCGTKFQQPCDRIEVSSGFFRSPEFQDRGYFVFRFYPVSLGRNPFYAEFMPDLAKVSGFLTDAQLEANKVAFVQEFMARQEFQTKYGALADSAFVDALLQSCGLPNHPSKDGWKAGLANSRLTRAQVLRALIESAEVYNKFYNQSFVVMQYFGYLRRDPDILYLNWIDTMNKNGGDYRTMINGFMNSSEYFLRFGP